MSAAIVRDPAPTVTERVELGFARAGGRERLEGELRRLAVDVVGRCEHDELDREAKESLRHVTDAAVAASSAQLVASFTAELGRGIEGLPAYVRERLLRAEKRRQIGQD